jgi:hypothetical protein
MALLTNALKSVASTAMGMESPDNRRKADDSYWVLMRQ